MSNEQITFLKIKTGLKLNIKYIVSVHYYEDSDQVDTLEFRMSDGSKEYSKNEDNDCFNDALYFYRNGRINPDS